FAASGFDAGSMGQTNSDGIHPEAGLTLSSNRLYGAMSAGGLAGSGTIFAVNTDGSGFTNLHSFGNLAVGWNTNEDGATPRRRLVLGGDELYGTAIFGGTEDMGSGTVFKLRTDGSGFRTLHSFSFAATNGHTPNGLTLSGNTLYGTTQYGSSNYNGSVFRINTDGSGFACIYSFSAGAYNPGDWSYLNMDGAYPEAAPVAADGLLYGTTTQGGKGAGTVFKLNPDGTGFTVLHSFTNGDGSAPRGELLRSGSALYGTTYAGGGGGSGTVFRLNTNGSGFATLYSFSASADEGLTGVSTNSDGANPSGPLLLSGGVLYGTTRNGGTGGSGTLFALSTNGVGFTNLYSFTALSSGTNLDGANPYGGAVLSDDMLYASACNGGIDGNGALFGLSLVAGAPWLDIHFTGDVLVVSWPSVAEGWRLQDCEEPATGQWQECALTVSDDGTNKSVTLPPPRGSIFFRLTK
ncbi:MAG: choice-of-anchor tandem repeat GloVer-containing protein, partial [Verrucomicrobiota bacterium]